MSMVGPRPLLRRELPDYGAVITLYERVRPGITGLWQTSGRSHTTFAERVSYDEWYIKNWTVWYDIVILLQTIWFWCTARTLIKEILGSGCAAKKTRWRWRQFGSAKATSWSPSRFERLSFPPAVNSTYCLP